jgi:hypothetical protein
MEQFAREDVRGVFNGFGVVAPRRATPSDQTEEVFLLDPGELAGVDIEELTFALMNVLPHTKCG